MCELKLQGLRSRTPTEPPTTNGHGHVLRRRRADQGNSNGAGSRNGHKPSGPASKWAGRGLLSALVPRSTLLHRLIQLVLLACLANAVVICVIVYHMSIAANNFGGATYAAERLKTEYPFWFVRFINSVEGLQDVFGSAANRAARAYFEHQWPVIEARASDFKLHPYFSKTVAPPADALTWHAMIHARILSFKRQLDEENRHDFRLEKDKCAMLEIYGRAGFRLPRVLGHWDDRERLIAALRSGEAIRSATPAEWPVFIKACHLTQSSSQGTRALKGPEDLQGESLEELVEWVRAKWTFRANDFERVWVNEGDALTATLTPGFAIQAAMPQGTGEGYSVGGRFAIGLAELRVEVVWGHAYLALLDGSMVFLRDGTLQDYTTPLALLKIASGYNERVEWIRQGKYLDCVWEVAERAAALSGVDCIRMDIFLEYGNPTGCAINENSLSSGMVYWGHDSYMAEAWAKPHRSRKYKLMNTSKSVIEVSIDDTH